MVDLNKPATKSLSVTVDGQKVSARKVPFGLAMSLYENAEDDKVDVSPQKMAEIIAKCLVYRDSGERVYGDDQVDEILDKDSEVIMDLFREISGFSSPSVEEAEKN